MMPKAVGLLAIRSERSIRAAPEPANADWSMPPADMADTNRHTCFAWVVVVFVVRGR